MNSITFCDCANDSVNVLESRLSLLHSQKDIALVVEADMIGG